MAEYRKRCEDMNIGGPIKVAAHEFTLHGKSGFIVQCVFDEYVFASLFDADGNLVAEGSSDSSEFGWNNGV